MLQPYKNVTGTVVFQHMRSLGKMTRKFTTREKEALFCCTGFSRCGYMKRNVQQTNSKQSCCQQNNS